MSHPLKKAFYRYMCVYVLVMHSPEEAERVKAYRRN
jgi:hypothetical protein